MARLVIQKRFGFGVCKEVKAQMFVFSLLTVVHIVQYYENTVNRGKLRCRNRHRVRFLWKKFEIILLTFFIQARRALYGSHHLFILSPPVQTYPHRVKSGILRAGMAVLYL